MKAVSLSRPQNSARLADYVILAKPRISVLVLFTVGIGVLLASLPNIPLAIFFHAVLGTALVATGASALNQWLECDSDARMRRTRNRPLPAGRMSSLEVLGFGVVCGVVGTAYLWLTLASPCAAILAAFTFFSYVCVYTPLKRITTLNTLIGAIPGAMPPVIGWAAVTGEVSPEAMTLFVILFLWQVPHFLAIAWMYREEYARAGLVMLPVTDADGSLTARQMILYCVALAACSLGPVLLGSASWLYVVGALLLGLTFIRSTIYFAVSPTVEQARRVLRASLIYLPGLLFVLFVDRSIHLLLIR